jgi:hypothetical protein
MGGISLPKFGNWLGDSAAGAIGMGKKIKGADDPNPLPPLSPDATDEAVQNARIMERRKQIGMNGRMSTFLTTSGGDSAAYNSGSQSMNTPTTVLGG